MASMVSIRLLLLTLFASVCYARRVQFDLRLTWETGAPDGQPRQMVKMNGQFPGPQLNLNYGDSVEFHVHNQLPVEASVHFHGIEQKGTPEYDGVPGLTQTPIQPGDSYTYKWTATQYGSYWYHGHVVGLVSDGLYGAISIQPPNGVSPALSKISNSSRDRGIMQRAIRQPYTALVSDWTKFTSDQYYQAEHDSGYDLYCVDSILLNGKGAVNCQPQSLLDAQVNPNLGKLLQAANLSVSDKGCTPMSPAALTQGNFQPTYPEKVPEGLAAGCKATSGSQEVFHASSTERWAAFNFISAASNKAIVIAIDQHPMWVYAVDGVFVEPQQVDTLFVYNGERYSVLVALDQTPGDYTIRIANNLPDQLVSGYGTLSYVNGNKKTNSTPTINYGGVATLPGARALQTAVLSPLAAPPVAQAADATYVLEMGRYQANWRWTMTNESSYLPETNNSGTPLLQLTDPAAYAKAHSDHIIATRNGSWVDLVVVSGIGPSNPAQPPHPIHKHGNKGYVIGGGNGMFNWSSVAEAQKAQPEAFNLVNPPYRDGFVTPPVLFAPAWVAFRYYVDNPGAWLLHCHIQTHLVGGMALAVLDGVDQWPAGASGASGYVTKGNA